MKWLKQIANNEYLVFIKAKPNARKSAFIKITDDHSALEIALKAMPIDGEANAELINFLSKKLNIKKSNVCLCKGEQSKYKQIILKDINEEKLLYLLE